MCRKPVFVNGFWADCGRCISCRKKKAREWTIRLLHEHQSWKNVTSFVTFTYDKEHIHKGYGLCHRDYQLFMKRLREHFAGRKIKYFVAGEYGPKTGRPHYHAIIFGIGPSDARKYIPQLWGLGSVHVGVSITPAVMSYVSQYIIKKLSKECYDTTRPPPYLICSKGLGYSPSGDRYTNGSMSEWFFKGYCSWNEHKYPIPRYYFKVLHREREIIESYISEGILVDNYDGWYGFVRKLPSRSDYYKHFVDSASVDLVDLAKERGVEPFIDFSVISDKAYARALQRYKTHHGQYMIIGDTISWMTDEFYAFIDMLRLQHDRNLKSWVAKKVRRDAI